MDTWIAVGALGANLVTVGVLAWQAGIMRKSMVADHERRRKQATVEFVTRIRKEYHPLQRSLVAQFGRNHIINMSDVDEGLRDKIRELLPIVEHLAVGVNVGVYDLDILERMSGSYFLRLHATLSPYIDEVRRTNNNGRLYIELEELCMGIREIRRKKTERGNIVHSLEPSRVTP